MTPLLFTQKTNKQTCNNLTLLAICCIEFKDFLTTDAPES